MDVMNGRSHRWGRSNRVLRWLRFPTVITLPGGRRRQRYAYLFWRVLLAGQQVTDACCQRLLAGH
jgi:hypothetical protein